MRKWSTDTEKGFTYMDSIGPILMHKKTAEDMTEYLNTLSYDTMQFVFVTARVDR